MELKIEIINGDCLEVLKTYPDNFFDSVVTDPPYGLSFMGKKWDYQIPQVEIWKEVFRVLKHGGHILVACGTRTQHRMAVNIEDAGFEIRDVITWHYGSGFPKSLDVSKAIDKMKGAERKVISTKETKSGGMANVNKVNKEQNFRPNNYNEHGNVFELTEPSTDEAKHWNGWGTALKPATEFFTLARKPLSEPTVASNVLKHGTGAINIDGTRIGLQKRDEKDLRIINRNIREGDDGWGMQDNEADKVQVLKEDGRFPANVIFSHHNDCVCVGIKKVKGTSTGNGEAEEGEESNGAITPIRRGKFTDRTDENGEETIEEWKCVNGCPIKELDEQSGVLTSGAMIKPYVYQNNGYSLGKPTGQTKQIHESNSGGASRFFYCAKASKSERNKGLENFQLQENKHSTYGIHSDEGLINNGRNPENRSRLVQNFHPTVKPVKVIQYLVKMITPQNGTLLDPFAGSCTAGIVCKIESINGVLIEREKEYCEIGKARIDSWDENIEYEKQMEVYKKDDSKEEKNNNQLEFF